jgi:molybdopterin-guanine dinucleotide biosynthesis protein A
MIDLLGERQIVVPCEGKFCHPLAAVYRLDVLPLVEQLLAADRLRPAFLFDQADTSRIMVEELRAVDSELSTLANLNHPEDYLRALAAEGLAPEPGVVQKIIREG